MDTLISDVSAKTAAERWLSDFAAALTSGDGEAIAALFGDECYWRDILAFTWDLHTTAGASAIARRLRTGAERLWCRATCNSPSGARHRAPLRAPGPPASR